MQLTLVQALVGLVVLATFEPGEDVTLKYCPGSDEVEPGTAIQVRAPATAGEPPLFDCVYVTPDAALEIYRPQLALRRVCFVQRLTRTVPSHPTPPPRPRRWCGEPQGGEMPTSMSPEGIAADVSGRHVYVTAVSPRSMVVFDRNQQTGVLTFETSRDFSTRLERDDFLRARRRELIELRRSLSAGRPGR